jgi:ATP adenylyltransferase
MAYIKGENKPPGGGTGEGCPFCAIPRLDDGAGLVVHRGRQVYAVLNLYPYNSGHLMVCPELYGYRLSTAYT